MSRVVVTGLGAASPFGAGIVAYWKGLSGGVCAIRELTLIDTQSFRCRIGAEVSGPLAGSARRTRADRLAIGAAAEALADAGLGARDRRSAAVVVGAVGGGMLEAEAWYWHGAGDPRPASLRGVLPCAQAEALASRFRIGGPRHTVVTACSSGAVALSEAAALIADGVVDVALAGGVDSITRICFMGFNALKLLDPTPCRPFDRERRGMSIGEGAGFVVLESEAHARGRHARVYATPSMILDVEHTCRELILHHADAGEDSVGMEVSVKHLAATLVDMTVEILVTVIAVDGRKVTFEVAAKDDIEPICSGTHVRFVVDVNKTKERLQAKAAKRAALK